MSQFPRYTPVGWQMVSPPPSPIPEEDPCASDDEDFFETPSLLSLSDEGSQEGDDDAKTTFSNAQLQELTGIVTKEFARPRAKEGDRNRDQAHRLTTKRWKAREIGYFKPMFDADEPFETHNNAIYYHDVYTFIDRLREAVSIFGHGMVSANLENCLLGAALNWAVTKLSLSERAHLCTLDLETGWFARIVEQFKPTLSEAHAKLKKLHFGLENVRKQERGVHFAQKVMRYVRATGVESTSAQLSQAWLRFDKSLRDDIPNPTRTTAVEHFLNQIDSKAASWKKQEERRSPPRSVVTYPPAREASPPPAMSYSPYCPINQPVPHYYPPQVYPQPTWWYSTPPRPYGAYDSGLRPTFDRDRGPG